MVLYFYRELESPDVPAPIIVCDDETGSAQDAPINVDDEGAGPTHTEDGAYIGVGSLAWMLTQPPEFYTHEDVVAEARILQETHQEYPYRSSAAPRGSIRWALAQSPEVFLQQMINDCAAEHFGTEEADMEAHYEGLLKEYEEANVRLPSDKPTTLMVLE